jgi:hypothetical protein
VVDSAVLFTWTTLVVMNPEPDTVRVCALAPAVNLAGLMDEMDGVGVVVPPPADPPEPEPATEPPPPHPFTKAGTHSAKTKTRKRTEESHNLHDEQTLSKDPSFANAINSIVRKDYSSRVYLRATR